ncbi:Paraquat-inducible protein B [Neorhodopirellula pilleata]|uniref:Paraquat-inducible protein B n=2 Tax=Neorhodopirellula pilleata TaxID=2714738 RepID=A0A5C5ZZ71_9BACT|nr:Paraquat-inducible protein B [Neorhodopirellula pilleata]
MWWLAVVCLILAIGLTWASMDSPGREITIRFDQGHGLAEGDSIRHRGIEIGRVQSVQLMPDLSGIEVVAVLERHAKEIARRGSRFWIVHPQVDFGGVRGLETAIGAKYIRVLPGDGPEVVDRFDGMSVAPPDGAEQAGVEVVLRGEDRYGLSAGSPVTFRGVEVGRVLSSSLSPDAKYVDTIVQIVSPHDRLVSSDTKFWKTSGIDIAVSLKGVELSAQSLATVLRGGVAFATPGNRTIRTDSTKLAEGFVFELHEKADPQWLDSQAAINVLSEPIPTPIAVRASWSEKTFGFNRKRIEHASALVIEGEHQDELVFPCDLIKLQDSGEKVSFDLSLVIDPMSSPESQVSLIPTLQGREVPVSDCLVTRIAIDDLSIERSASSEIVKQRVSRKRLRSPDQIEDCFVVRYAQSNATPSSSTRSSSAKGPSSPSGDGSQTVLLEMIGSQDLRAGEGFWRCSTTRLSRDLWHGAPVISAKDEKCIGMLVVDAGEVRIAIW